MNLGINKLASRKAMRVATVFTGVTACAAAFAPAANAQTAGQIAPGRTVGHGTARSTRIGNCDNTPHYFHMYGGYGSAYMCIGGTGTYTFSAPDPAVAFCGGNNVGYFSGYNTAGNFVKDQRFHQSSNPYVWGVKEFSLTKVHISAWTGDQSCPSAIPAP
jgi:hypothetical protein